jgi:arylsulfatase A
MKSLAVCVITLFLITAIGTSLAGMPSANPNAPDSHDTPVHRNKKPNIIFIMADDMGKETLGAYGSVSYKTPNLDRLAKQGVKFENMFAQPLCTPSRVKIMTGENNFRNYTIFGYLNPKETTFGNILKKAGYSTMIAGKWQLNGISKTNLPGYKKKKPGWDDKNRPHHFGFEDYTLWQLTKTSRKDGRVDGRYANPLIIHNGHQLPRNKNAYGPNIFSKYVVTTQPEKGVKRIYS